MHNTQFGQYSFDLAEAARSSRSPPATQTLAVPGLRDRVRHQGAAVPVPHVAARRARRGADGRLDHPGRRAAEDGDLRPGAVRVPAVPRGRAPVGAGPGDARRHRHRLRGARRHGPARHEEAGGVLVGEPPRLRRARHVRDERQRRAGRRLSDDRARREHGRALPARRHALGSAPHPPHRGVRRPQERRAALRGGVLPDYAVVDRAAGPQRVRRRVPHPAGRVSMGLALRRRAPRAASSSRPSTCCGCSSA